MKPLLVLVLILSLSSGAFSQGCILDSSATADGYPNYLPCIEKGVSYSASLSFASPSHSIYYRIDSIKNLPCGIMWSTTNPLNTFGPGEPGCLFFSGTTHDSIGQYNIDVYVTIQVGGMPIDVKLSTWTGRVLPVRVKNPANSCPPVDTSAAGQSSTCNSGYGNIDHSSISGKVFYDNNQNGIQDSNDHDVSHIFMEINGTNYWAITNLNGAYNFDLLPGSYNIEPDLSFSQYDDWIVTTQPPSYNYNFTSGGNVYTNQNFGVYDTLEGYDISVKILLGVFRPGFNTPQVVKIENLGTEPYSGTINYEYDTSANFVLSMPPPSAASGSNLSWNISNLGAGQVQDIFLNFSLPADTNLIGDSLYFSADANWPLDNYTYNNYDDKINVVRAPWDPNDKQVFPAGNALPGDELEYYIRFQNTGTDTAINVEIRDTLDSNIDALSLQDVVTSHDYYLTVEEGNILVFNFYNIMLPDSNVNEPESHGFIHYSIKIDDTTPLGTNIENRAAIYFDFNPPVITNTVSTLVDSTTGIFEVTHKQIGLTLYPNPNSGSFSLLLDEPLQDYSFEVYNLSGEQIYHLTRLTGRQQQLNMQGQPGGMYFYQLKDTKGHIVARGKLLLQQ